MECTTTGSRADTSLSIGGRIKDPALKAILAKQLNVGLSAIEAQGQVDLKTGKIASKKAKKEKSPEQMALAEVKNLCNKCPSICACFMLLFSNRLPSNCILHHLRWKKLSNDIPACLKEFTEHSVRNSCELVSWLRISASFTSQLASAYVFLPSCYPF